MIYRIKEYRLKRGMTIEHLARAAGITRTYLSLIENGKADNISTKVLVRIASALDTKVDDLLDSVNFSSKDC